MLTASDEVDGAAVPAAVDPVAVGLDVPAVAEPVVTVLVLTPGGIDEVVVVGAFVDVDELFPGTVVTVVPPFDVAREVGGVVDAAVWE